jgi:diacylglycerol kinase family enzyme
VGNISRYAVGLRICRDARFDDGLLDLVVFSCREQGSLVLHAAWTILRLHPLKGKLRVFWAVTVRANWRVIFRFDGDAEDVDYVDYH